MKFTFPEIFAEGEYVQSYGNCCTRFAEYACGIGWRTNS